MAATKIAGIMRAEAYSPNHIGNDAAIFNAVADGLRRQGCEVNVYSETQFAAGAVQERIIFNMCRESRSIRLLQQLEDDGALVFNSGYGIENCMRERMTRLLDESGIPSPESLLVATDENVLPLLEERGYERCWVKRGDSHTVHKEDVAYARHPEEAQAIVKEFSLRGISRAVINRHLDGDLIKFYGVADASFFYWFYPFEAGHSKYGCEAVNGAAHRFRFDEEELKRIAQRAGDALDVKIYGGDCIVGADGKISVIDFNDFPSFAPCREEAAARIAEYILKEIKHTVL